MGRAAAPGKGFAAAVTAFFQHAKACFGLSEGLRGLVLVT